MIGSDPIGLLFRAKGDTADAKKSFNDLKDSINRDTKQIETDVAGASDGVGASLSSFGGYAAIAAAGLAAVTTAAVATGTALFNLVKNASDYGSTIKDFQDKTGLAADTIQTLGFNAKQSGISLDQLSAPIAKFTKQFYEMQTGGDKAAKTLEKFGVTKFDTLDDALGKVFAKIHDGTTETEKSGLAMEAFGAKSGTVMRAVADNIDGNLSKAIARAKELGIVLSEEDVKAADDFGDTMALLGTQAESLGNKFALTLAPQITGAMSQISESLAKNQVAVAFWAEVARGAFIGLGTVVQDFVDAFAAVFNRVSNDIKNLSLGMIDLGKITGNIAGNIYGNFEKDYYKKQEADLAQSNAEKDFRRLTSGNKTYDDSTTSGGGAEKTRKAREDALKKQLDLTLKYNKLEIEAEQLKFNDLERLNQAEFEKGAITAEQSAQRTLDNLRDLQANVANLMTAAFQTSRQGESSEEYKVRLKEYEIDLKKWWDGIDKQKDAVLKKNKEAEKKDSEDRIKLREDELKKDLLLIEAKRKEDLAAKGRFLQQGLLKQSEYEDEVEKIEEKALENSRNKLLEYLGELDKKSEKYLETANKIYDIESQLQERLNKLGSAVPGGGRGADGTPDPSAGDKINNTRGGGGGFFGGLIEGFAQYMKASVLVEDANGNLKFSFTKMFETIANLGLEAFSQLAQGFGSMVSSWVLYGNTGGLTLRKLAAQILSNLAGIATQYAVMCLAAAAFATTAFGAALMGGTPAQFLAAAALFGAIAVGTALVGRAVAGDSFKANQAATASTSGAYGSSTRSGGTVGAYSSRADGVITESRAAASAYTREPVDIRLTLDSDGVLKVLRDNVQRNGMMRHLIIQTAGEA